MTFDPNDLTPEDVRALTKASAICIALHKAFGLQPCGDFYSAPTGWHERLHLCGCEYPAYRLDYVGDIRNNPSPHMTFSLGMLN